MTDRDLKFRLRSDHTADLVDMESMALARLCAERRIPWCCARAISDAADTDLPPDMLSLVHEDGRPRLSAAFMYALRHPSRIGALIQLGRDTTAAARALTDRVIELLEARPDAAPVQ